MTIFVTLDSAQGDIARWESGGAKPRLTHRAGVDQPVIFTADQVSRFRDNPPEEFLVTPAGACMATPPDNLIA